MKCLRAVPCAALRPAPHAALCAVPGCRPMSACARWVKGQSTRDSPPFSTARLLPPDLSLRPPPLPHPRPPTRPRQVLPYFEALGFACPKTKPPAEFLQEVTLPDGLEKYRGPPAPSDAPGGPVPIRGPADFGAAWRQSEPFRRRAADDLRYAARSRRELDALPPDGPIRYQWTRTYTPPPLTTLWLCLRRQARLTARNPRLSKGRVAQAVVVGLVLGSLFWRLAAADPVDPDAVFALLFFALLPLAVGGMAAVPGIVAERRVIYRQTAAKFFHPLSYTVAHAALDIPVSALEAGLFSAVVYGMAGLSPVLSDFALFVLTVFLTAQAMTALFKVLDARPRGEGEPVCTVHREGGGGRDASEGKGPQRRPQRRLGRRLEGVAEAVGGGYCRLQMPLRMALGVRGTVAGHRSSEGGGGGDASPPFQCIRGAGVYMMDVEEQGTCASRTQKHSEVGYGRPVDRGAWAAKTVKRPLQQPAQPPIRQLLGAADAQTAHPATSSTAPAHQRLGSVNAETTPARAPAAAADRMQRPDATCEGTNG